ncbi:TPA: hypothetical protein QHF22_003188 [Legionella pneumophila]|uniref:Uncharacterized protein n=2 Tax=Legionella pneumophila TaxID=446 RepID=A0A3A6UII4_LEGPN|nr:hypothetical protein A9P84_01010 [Legionella pneumophila]QOD89729.1 hypothetical protein IF130_01025 [Legionella pneumophila subsp. pneumophila]PPK29026.1 hypothetical protein C3929_01045 [Legionella pneumophila]PYB42851.1 hypothetical protein DM453_16825 [Legionella pneumophila]PYB60762.1 hypothetical protein DMC17_16840 [Legionella pneumophila]
MLKPQDIVILLKMLANKNPQQFIQKDLATYLCMSASEVHEGMKRLTLSHLLVPVSQESDTNSKRKKILTPIKAACEECLIYGVKYFCPVRLGEYTRGIPTSYAAPLFAKYIVLGSDPIPIWPYAEGDHRGLALEPLYRSVPQSITKHPDQIFYELLVFIDAIRTGRARERALAIKLLRERISLNEST